MIPKGRRISRLFTVNETVASASSGAPARNTTVPGVRPVTGMAAVVPPARMVAVAGMLNTPWLLKVSAKVMPLAGAGPDKVNVIFLVSFSSMVKVTGAKLIVPAQRACACAPE